MLFRNENLSDGEFKTEGPIIYSLPERCYYIKSRQTDRQREKEDTEFASKLCRWRMQEMQREKKKKERWDTLTSKMLPWHNPHCRHLVRWLLSRYPCDARRQRKQQLFTSSISGTSLQRLWRRTWFILTLSSPGRAYDNQCDVASPIGNHAFKSVKLHIVRWNKAVGLTFRFTSRLRGHFLSISPPHESRYWG